MGKVGGTTGKVLRNITPVVGDVLNPREPNVPRVRRAKTLTAEQQRAKAAEKTRLLQIRSRSAQGFESTDNTKIGGAGSLLGAGG